jgi:hypothetical protein
MTLTRPLSRRQHTVGGAGREGFTRHYVTCFIPQHYLPAFPTSTGSGEITGLS